MTTETMTIHKALCELKTLDDRIKKAITSISFTYANKHSNQAVDGVPISEFNSRIKEGYQSVSDLMKRRDALKRAVVLSNAKTEVTVGGRVFTVAEAIEIKNHGIPLKKFLLTSMSESYDVSQSFARKYNGESLEARANEYVKTMYANADVKNLSEDMKRSREDFIAAQTVDIVDPLNVTDKMKKLEAEISAFEVDIDSALSTSNALTTITIEY